MISAKDQKGMTKVSNFRLKKVRLINERYKRCSPWCEDIKVLMTMRTGIAGRGKEGHGESQNKTHHS
jgi:hypothetical protein